MQASVQKKMYIMIYELGWRRLWANENQSIYNLYNYIQLLTIESLNMICDTGEY